MTTLDQEKSIARVLHAIEALKNEGMVIMVDQEDRENEGDIVFAAQHVTPRKNQFYDKASARSTILGIPSPAIC